MLVLLFEVLSKIFLFFPGYILLCLLSFSLSGHTLVLTVSGDQTGEKTAMQWFLHKKEEIYSTWIKAKEHKTYSD